MDICESSLLSRSGEARVTSPLPFALRQRGFLPSPRRIDKDCQISSLLERERHSSFRDEHRQHQADDGLDEQSLTLSEVITLFPSPAEWSPHSVPELRSTLRSLQP